MDTAVVVADMVILTATDQWWLATMAAEASEACPDDDSSPRMPHADACDCLIGGGGGDRMSGLGAGLSTIDWSRQQLSKFEKK